MNIYDTLECEKIGACSGIKLHKADPGKDYTGWSMSEKLDGVSGVYAKGKLFSLSGLPLMNTSELVESMGISSWACVTFGEITSEELTLEQLSGVLNPNTKNELPNLDLAFTAFDQVTVREYIAGHSIRAWEARLLSVEGTIQIIQRQTVNCMADMDAFFHWITGGGGEGIVVRDPFGQWARGRRARDVLKRVKEYRLDLKVLDIVEGKGKRAGTVGRVALEFKNERINADLGKGFDDARRNTIWIDREKYIGRIADVKCLSISSTGHSLRLPKIEAFRIDREQADG